MTEQLLSTREVAEKLGISVAAVYERARKRGIGQTGKGRGHPLWFTADEMAQLNQPRVKRKLSSESRPCPRCEILTPDGRLCDDCRFELAHDGHYRVVDELTGVAA